MKNLAKHIWNFGNPTTLNEMRVLNTFRTNLRFDSVSLNVLGYVVPPGVETSCPLICSTAFVQQMGKKFLYTHKLILTLGLILISTVGICSTVSAEQAQAQNRVYFKSPANHATVSSPITVVMGVEGMNVGAAGTVVPNIGHHHIIIDGGPIKTGEVIPADAAHVHFGKGQTETTLTLPPGPHTLTLQFADGSHHSYGPEMATTINVDVK